MRHILIAGDGPVARALANALAAAGEVTSRWRRGDPRPTAAAEIAIVAVRDAAISAVATQLMALGAVERRSILLHCAGVLPPEEAFRGLPVAGIGLLHPLRALVGDPDEAHLAGTVFGVAGDALGVKTATELVEGLGGRPLPLGREALARYHAAAALASNHPLALVDQAVDLLVELGLDRATATSSLAELVASMAHNLIAQGLPRALTGPIARGDVATIARHWAALPEETRPLYRATARATVALARKKGAAEGATLDAIAALLEGD